MDLQAYRKQLEATRAATVERMDAIMEKSAEASRSMEEAEQQEYDGLDAEIKQLDEDLVRVRRQLKLRGEAATEVEDPAPGHKKAISSLVNGDKPKGPTIVIASKDQDEVFEGQNFTRKVKAMLLAKEMGCQPWQVAEQLWGKTNPTLVGVMKTIAPKFGKAAVGGHGGDAGEAGSELVTADNRYTGDFIEFLYSKTVYDQLGLRVVPPNVTIKEMDGAATGYWVGEGKAIPMSVADFNAVSLTYKKVAALTSASMEWLEHADPSGEMLLRDALVNAAAQRIDTTFVGNAVGVAGSTPAGILYNIAGTVSAGTDTDGLVNDIKELNQRFITAKNPADTVYVMNPGLANAIGLLRNALGQKEYPDVNKRGGTLEGDPVIVGHNVNANYFIQLAPSDIWRIGSGGIRVAMSDSATIEQSSTPAGEQDTPTAQANQQVGMFQTDSMAIKVVIDIDFARRRESAVAWINNATYGASVST